MSVPVPANRPDLQFAEIETDIEDLQRSFIEKHKRIAEHVDQNPLPVVDDRTLGQRLADGVASVMGSWRFILVQSGALTIWIVLNVTGVIGKWDPYPFILLNLMLSFQAAYAAPIIVMSQNRKEAKDRQRADHDYLVNLSAELGVSELHAKIDALRQTQWATLLALQGEQIELLRSLAAAQGPLAAAQGPLAVDEPTAPDLGAPDRRAAPSGP
ncbi:MAG: DUF1003 domain-containing protein [Pseudomonadota bacterium]|nr:DUF1003 domain-containing protein [Pseudomonadota bacterium]